MEAPPSTLKPSVYDSVDRMTSNSRLLERDDRFSTLPTEDCG